MFDNLISLGITGNVASSEAEDKERIVALEAFTQ